MNLPHGRTGSCLRAPVATVATAMPRAGQGGGRAALPDTGKPEGEPRGSAEAGKGAGSQRPRGRLVSVTSFRERSLGLGQGGRGEEQ